MPHPAETPTTETNPVTRKARRKAGARRRAQIWRDRRAPERIELQTSPHVRLLQSWLILSISPVQSQPVRSTLQSLMQ
ncbi:hypothetical protein AX289_26140 [Methylorubrum populi]|nr:hypothetical protein AX289_26140 [Methylorubrum populi]